MKNFSFRTQVFFGEGSLKRLSQLDCHKAFIVTDPFMVKSGVINKITDEISNGNVEYIVFSDIIPDPSIEIVAKGIEVMMKFNPDVVIALGGGSAIDAAKAICDFNSKLKANMNSNMGSNKKIKLIAIPTTSGTDRKSVV